MARLDEVLELMRKEGLRITPQRRLLLRHILKSKGALDARKLMDSVHKDQPDISLDTVYRNLNALCGLGVLCRVAKLGKGSEYEFVAGRHVHYMTCTDCGRREVFDGCSVSCETLAGQNLKGFRLTGHKLDLYGLCADCAGKGFGT